MHTYAATQRTLRRAEKESCWNITIGERVTEPANQGEIWMLTEEAWKQWRLFPEVFSKSTIMSHSGSHEDPRQTTKGTAGITSVHNFHLKKQKWRGENPLSRKTFSLDWWVQSKAFRMGPKTCARKLTQHSTNRTSCQELNMVGVVWWRGDALQL